jgi:hypothetical protein
MTGLVAPLLAIFLAQDPGAKAPQDSVSAQAAAFQSAIDEKRFDRAQQAATALVARYVELGRQVAPHTPTKDAPAGEPSANAKSDRKAISDALEKAVKSPRLPAEFQRSILAQLDVRLGDCDRLLERSIKLDHIKDASATYAAGIKALGTYHRTQYIDVLEKIVASDLRAEVMNAAAGALGEYFGEKEATRKQIVGALVLAYSSAGYGFNGGGTQRVLVNSDLVLQIRHDFQWALARLTGGVHFDRAIQWSEWWRDAKDRPWRDGVDRPNVKLDNIEPGPAPGAKPGGH